MVRFSLLFQIGRTRLVSAQKIAAHEKSLMNSIRAASLFPLFLGFFSTSGPLTHESELKADRIGERLKHRIMIEEGEGREKHGSSTSFSTKRFAICLLTDVSKNSCPGGGSSTVSSIQWLDGGWLSHRRQFSDFTVVLPDSSITRFMHTSSMHYKQAPRIQITHTK